MKKIKLLLCIGLLVLGISATAWAVPIAGAQIYATGGDVWVQVAPSSSGYTHQLGLYSPTFDNIVYSKAFGSTVNLGPFAEHTELIFGLHVFNTGLVFKTGGGERNPDGIAHAVVDFSSDGFATMRFEDLFNGGDHDFNDAVFTLSGVTSVHPVPEPASLLLFGAGIIGLASLGRRKTN